MRTWRSLARGAEKAGRRQVRLAQRRAIVQESRSAIPCRQEARYDDQIMQLRFFTIPVHDSGDAAEELNRFLAGHRITAIDRSFVQDGANSAWLLCVSFEPAGNGRPQAGKRGKVDYREVLNEQDFAVFARLRTLQAGYATAQAITAHADAAAWRREQLLRRPLAQPLADL